MHIDKLAARVHAVERQAARVLSLDLRPVDPGQTFPAFSAGARIDLFLDNGLIRSYSLCNAPHDQQRYQVAVLDAENSRGGSHYIHRQIREGDCLTISVPRNHFAWVPAAFSVFVAGGIGITPILSMLHAVEQAGAQAALIFCARSRSEAAFVEQLARFRRLKVTLHFDDKADGPPALHELLAGHDPASHFYCCGPSPMLDAFSDACAHLGFPNTHLERFVAAPHPPSSTGAFRVILERSGQVIEVGQEQSVLDALLEAGLSPPYSCREGLCGTCETGVLSGEVEHCDAILSEQEKAANRSMMICVSRCRSDSLVLDL